jgi:hypothetical protein
MAFANQRRNFSEAISTIALAPKLRNTNQVGFDICTGNSEWRLDVLDNFGKPVFRVRLLAESLEEAAGFITVSAETPRSSPPRQEFHFMVTERGADTPRSAGCATIHRCFRGDISEELSMTKSILVSLAVLTLSTSAALAAHPTHHRHAIHRHATNANASVGASPVVWTGGVSSSDRATYIRNLHDSGYNTKGNFNASGNLVTQ